MSLPEIYDSVRTTFDNDTMYFSIIDVIKLITENKDNSSASSYWSSWCKNKSKYKKLYFTSTDKKKIKSYGATIQEMSELIADILQSYRNYSVEKKQQLLENFNVKKYISPEHQLFIFKNSDETGFIDKLIQFLKPSCISGIRQYPVLNYRIDFYIEYFNVAIEYDENGHKSYNPEDEEKRMNDIKSILGDDCHFIRVSNENSDDYNLGYVSKELYQIITDKLLNEN